MFHKQKNVHALVTEQIKDVKKCLVLFESFMRAATVPDTSADTLQVLRDSVCKAEDAADISLRAMIDSLSDGSYLPSTKESIISIGTSCDKVANKCEYVANLVVIYGFKFPPEFSTDFNEIYDIIEAQFECLETAISMLFSDMHKLQKGPAILDKLRSLETEVDVLEMRISKHIFSMDIELAAKMQFFGLVEQLCDISDIIEDIADKIQIVLIARKA